MPYLAPIMTDQGFVHLRVHSTYSLAEGALRITEGKPKGGRPAPRKGLIELCERGAMPAVALTDKGNLFGALEFGQDAAEAGIQPIIGCQMAVARPGTTVEPAAPPREGYDQIVLLVQNELGYRNLSALVTQSYLAQDRPLPFVTREELALHAGGLLALTAGTEGAVGRLLAAGQKDAAEAALLALRDVFEGRLYIELCRHPGGPISALESRIEEPLIDLAYRYDLPLVATNDVYFGEADMYEAHEALLCIADKTFLSDPTRRRLTPHHHFASASAMRALFADLPEACDNTLVIAKRCAYKPPFRAPILPPFQTPSGRTEADELRVQAEDGLNVRLKAHGITDDAPYRERLAFELNVIISMGFAGYFLTVSDFIKWSKNNNIPVGPGRGSGAGSVVAWSLLITDLDPLRFGLLFERFLNPERVSMPDFDVDFCQERRDEVIRYVQSRAGADRVAQIITFGKLQARAVLRDVGRVLGMPYGFVDKICKLVPNNPAHPVSLQEALDSEPQLQQMRDEDASVQTLMRLALRLEGLYRNASTHAAGVVIGDRPLVELVPLYRDPGSPLPVTQFNMKMVEKAGLVKFDFLGLKTLDILQQAVDLVAEEGITLDLATLPLDDPPTYALLAKGNTTGVFQLESAGMRDILRSLKPNRFEDIIALVALYRPGPMDNIPRYIKVKNGEEPVTYLHPLLEPILKDTFGILIYQEQVMQAAQILANYSLGGADLLRRAMGKKKAEEMTAQRATFIEGAAKNGLSADQASLCFDQIDKFAGYGFNKSHAAAYALIAYQTAYLKTHHPVAFFSAVMNLERGDTEKLALLRQELLRQGIPVLPPDINRSGVLFHPERTGPEGRPAVRYALAAIKGVGDAAMQGLVAERNAHGPFRDLFDLAERVDSRLVNRKPWESLTHAGAFDALNRNRAQVLASLDLLLQRGHAAADERASGQTSLFGGPSSPGTADAAAHPALPATHPWDALTRLQREFQVLGFYLSAHPLDSYRALLDRLGVVPAAQLGLAKARAPTGPNRAKVAGIVTARQERTAKSGNRFAFVSASDTSGAFEVTVFSELLAQRRDTMEPGQAVLFEVEVQSGSPGRGGGGGSSGGGGDKSADSLRLIARSVERLEEFAARHTRGCRVALFDPEDVPRLHACLSKAPPGRGKIVLALGLDDGLEADVELPGGWRMSETLKADLRALGHGLEVQEA